MSFRSSTSSTLHLVLVLATLALLFEVGKGARDNHVQPIADFYAATEAQPFAPARACAGGSVQAAPRSTWLRIIQSEVGFLEEHTPKIRRSLADFASRWDTQAWGYLCCCRRGGEAHGGGTGDRGNRVTRRDPVYVTPHSRSSSTGSGGWPRCGRDGFPMLNTGYLRREQRRCFMTDKCTCIITTRSSTR